MCKVQPVEQPKGAPFWSPILLIMSMTVATTPTRGERTMQGLSEMVRCPRDAQCSRASPGKRRRRRRGLRNKTADFSCEGGFWRNRVPMAPRHRQIRNYPRPPSSRHSGLVGPHTTPPIVSYKYLTSTPREGYFCAAHARDVNICIWTSRKSVDHGTNDRVMVHGDVTRADGRSSGF